MLRRALLTGCLMLVTMLAGCNAKFPVITPIVPEWEENIPLSTIQIAKQLTAKVTNMADVSTLKVFVRFSRHKWEPGTNNAFMGEAVRDSQNRDLFAFTVTNPEVFLNTQLVLFKWFVVDQQPGGSETILAESPIGQFRVGCRGTGSDDSLKSDQRTVLGSFDNASRFPPSGYILPHRRVSFKGSGMAAAKVQVIAPGHVPTFGSPDLLMYAPGGPPFRLIGWAYTFPFHPEKRPRWNCIPYEAWFMHVAGWHTSDGLFEVQPNPLIHPSTGSAPFPAPPPFWHGPVWDLHIWRRDSAVPLLAIEDSTVAQSASDVAFPSSPCAFCPVDPTPFP